MLTKTIIQNKPVSCWKESYGIKLINLTVVKNIRQIFSKAKSEEWSDERRGCLP